MSEPAAALAADIRARARGRARYLVAIVGPPGAGKSTLAAGLLTQLEAAAPGEAALVPMDGFHLDNAVLEPRGLLARKGAPETFDADGLIAILRRIRDGSGPVAVPVFDRDRDLARAGARVVAPGQRIVLVEGNYLLLRDAPWSGLAALFDHSLRIDVTEEELRRRLVARWRDQGLPPDRAAARAEGNDLANARLVAARSRPADAVIPTP